MASLKEKSEIGIIITLLAVSSGQIIITNWQQTYYCQPEDNVKECIRLSSTNVTCYDWTGKGDRCVGGTWKHISEYLKKPIELQQFNITASDREWVCYIKDGKAHSYTKCYSGNYETYLGEKI